MRKLRDKAAPDDPGAWSALSNMWPTKRGTYETADTSTATEISTASTAAAIYAFASRTLTGTREFVVDATHIWEYSGGSLTDRTNGVALGGIGHPMFAQYGDVTIAVMGSATATAKSTSTTFSALAGAPQAEIIVVCRNAVVTFNTNTSADGWAASDVGDYTNWTTGEAASGRIIDTPGEILAAVVFGNDIIVFKRSAIYRMTYVGGIIKWQVQLAWAGMGICPTNSVTSTAKYQVAACASGVVFNAQTTGGTAISTMEIYLFDGASRPVYLNPETTVAMSGGVSSGGISYVFYPVFIYDPVDDVLCLASNQGAAALDVGVSGISSAYVYYSFAAQAWGAGSGASGEVYDSVSVGPGSVNGVVQGDYYAGLSGYRPIYYRYGSTNSKMRRCVPSAPATPSTCSITSSLYGRPDRKTTWKRLVPLLRNRRDLGTDSAVAGLSLYREREDTSVSGTQSSVTESTLRKRFDFQGGTATDNFAKMSVTWTDLDVEVDDFLVKSVDAGED